MPPPWDLAHFLLTLIEPILTVLDKQFTPRLDITACKFTTTMFIRLLTRDVLRVVIRSDGTVRGGGGAMQTKIKVTVQVWIDVLEIHEARVRIGQTSNQPAHSQILKRTLREFTTAVIIVPHVISDAQVFIQLGEERWCVVEGKIGGRDDWFSSDEGVGGDFAGGVQTESGVGDGGLCHVELTDWLGIEFLEAVCTGIGETGFIIIGVAQ
mmetsp:Transcript_52219/g.62917  ORF Transcript_52219/g.62917 Transcript_52219/m.62917 type:complete len:210 (+) Transcript_52219:350-979(+)